MSLGGAEEVIYALMTSYGYLGAFLSALISHLIPFIALPYLAIVWILASAVPSLNPWLIGLASGVGAGVGKVSSYIIGRGGAMAVGEDRRRQLEVLRGLVKDYAGLAAFIASATPLPDDVVLIAVGMIRYSLLKYLVATLGGKVVLCVSVAVLSSKFSGAVGWLVGARGGWVGLAASIAFMLSIAYLILRVDWSTVAEEVARSGWRGLAERARREGVGFLFTKRG